MGVLRCALDSPDRVTEGVNVPSHVSIVGNEQADALANQGRPANPLYPAAVTPKGSPPKYKHGNNTSLTSGTAVEDASGPSAMGNLGARRAMFPQKPPPAENTTQVWVDLGLTLRSTSQKGSDRLSNASSDYTDTASPLSGPGFSDLDDNHPFLALIRPDKNPHLCLARPTLLPADLVLIGFPFPPVISHIARVAIIALLAQHSCAVQIWCVSGCGNSFIIIYALMARLGWAGRLDMACVWNSCPLCGSSS